MRDLVRHCQRGHLYAEKDTKEANKRGFFRFLRSIFRGAKVPHLQLLSVLSFLSLSRRERVTDTHTLPQPLTTCIWLHSVSRTLSRFHFGRERSERTELSQAGTSFASFGTQVRVSADDPTVVRFDLHD
jgi:hypothetical protein